MMTPLGLRAAILDTDDYTGLVYLHKNQGSNNQSEAELSGGLAVTTTKSSKVCIKIGLPPASLPFKGQVSKKTTVKWSIGVFRL